MKNIRYEIKNLKGFILGIGRFDDLFLKQIMKNDNISFSILTNSSLDSGYIKKSSKLIDNNKNKEISVKKLRKVFKKNRPNYMIVDINEVYNYLKTFIKDSLYITNKKIYIYSSNKDIDINEIYKLYKRYNKNIIIDGDYIIIDMEGYKNSKIKNFLFYIVDTFVIFYNFISNVLTS